MNINLKYKVGDIVNGLKIASIVTSTYVNKDGKVQTNAIYFLENDEMITEMNI